MMGYSCILTFILAFVCRADARADNDAIALWTGSAGDGNYDTPTNWDAGVTPCAKTARIAEEEGARISLVKSSPSSSRVVIGVRMKVPSAGATTRITFKPAARLTFSRRGADAAACPPAAPPKPTGSIGVIMPTNNEIRPTPIPGKSNTLAGDGDGTDVNSTADGGGMNSVGGQGGGSIAGAVVGAILGVLLIVFMVLYWRQKQKNKDVFAGMASDRRATKRAQSMQKEDQGHGGVENPQYGKVPVTSVNNPMYGASNADAGEGGKSTNNNNNNNSNRALDNAMYSDIPASLETGGGPSSAPNDAYEEAVGTYSELPVPAAADGEYLSVGMADGGGDGGLTVA